MISNPYSQTEMKQKKKNRKNRKNKNERLLEGECNNGSRKENPRRRSTRFGGFQIRASSQGGGLLFRVRSFVSAIADFLVVTPLNEQVLEGISSGQLEPPVASNLSFSANSQISY
jgi:hypothetical protein